MTPVKSIRAYCLDCCGDSPKEVRCCPSSECPLHPFRMGKNPNAKRKMKKGTTEPTSSENPLANSLIFIGELKGAING